MFEPNPVEFELPYHQGLLMQLRGEWIAERKMKGLRAVLEFGTLKTPHTNLCLPGPLPKHWQFHALDGCLVGSIYYLFDVLALDGQDVRRRPLYERRTLLRSLCLPDWCRLVPCGKNIGEFLEAVIRDGANGIILKNLLERYGQAQWIKVECPRVEEVVITAVDEVARAVTVAQFQTDMLVECGTVFLGALLAQASVGQVLHVDMRCRTPASGVDTPRFLCFRADKIHLDKTDSVNGSTADQGRFIRF